MRNGYKQLVQALNWMTTNKPVDLTRQLGGVMACGKHSKCEVTQMFKSDKYIDFIFKNEDKQEHRQRVWSNQLQRFPFALGKVFNIYIEMTEGTHSIEILYDEKYTLKAVKTDEVILSSYKISDCFKKLYEINGKLSRPTISWFKEII